MKCHACKKDYIQRGSDPTLLLDECKECELVRLREELKEARETIKLRESDVWVEASCADYNEESASLLEKENRRLSKRTCKHMNVDASGHTSCPLKEAVGKMCKIREDNARLREALRMISEDVGGGFNAIECAVDALIYRPDSEEE